MYHIQWTPDSEIKTLWPIQYTWLLIGPSFALLSPYLNYAIESGYGAPEYTVEKIKVLQRKAIRAIFNLPYNEHTTRYLKKIKF